MRTRNTILLVVAIVISALSALCILVGLVVFALVSSVAGRGGPATTGPSLPTLHYDFSKTHLCDDIGWKAGEGIDHLWFGPCKLVVNLPDGRTLDTCPQKVMLTRSHDQMSGLLAVLEPQTKADAYVLTKRLMKEWQMPEADKLDAWYKLADKDEHGERRREFGSDREGYSLGAEISHSYSLDLTKPWCVTVSFGFPDMYDPPLRLSNSPESEWKMPMQEIRWNRQTSHKIQDVAWPQLVKEDLWAIQRPTHLSVDLPEGHKLDFIAAGVTVVRQGDTVIGFALTSKAQSQAEAFGLGLELIDRWSIPGRDRLRAWSRVPQANQYIDILQEDYYLRRFDAFQCGVEENNTNPDFLPYTTEFNVSFR